MQRERARARVAACSQIEEEVEEKDRETVARFPVSESHWGERERKEGRGTDTGEERKERARWRGVGRA